MRNLFWFLTFRVAKRFTATLATLQGLLVTLQGLLVTLQGLLATLQVFLTRYRSILRVDTLPSTSNEFCKIRILNLLEGLAPVFISTHTHQFNKMIITQTNNYKTMSSVTYNHTANATANLLTCCHSINRHKLLPYT